MKNLRKVEKISESYHNAYHETKRHADIMFAYNVYPCTIPQDFSFVPLHWQDSFEIIYVKRGMGRVQVNLDMFQAEAGDIFIVPPGHLHGLRGLEDYRMEYENIIFDMDFLRGAVLDNCSQKYLQPMLEGKLYFPVWIGNSHEMYGILSNYLDAADILMGQRGQGYELGVKGYLLLFFSGLFQIAMPKVEELHDNRRMEKIKMVLSYMEDHYNQKITVEEMAEECGYSASHFMRWFKEMTGTKFGSYLIELRLEKAARTLRTTEETVLEVAGKTGFNNLSNFNRLFKKKYGITPSEFRKKL